jgi:GLPGLI family protein
MRERGSITLGPTGPQGKIKFKVEKKYPEFKIGYLAEAGLDNYWVEDDRKMNWKILPEKEKIGEFTAQKATTDFVGRQWIAWFTSEIPIQDGPYKFHGLPGLIIKIEDSSRSHSFILKGAKKLDSKAEFKSFKSDENSKKPIVIETEKFKNIFLEKRADPNKKFRDLAVSGGSLEITDSSGKVMSMKEIMQMNEKRQREANRKNNNILEIDLLR